VVAGGRTGDVMWQRPLRRVVGRWIIVGSDRDTPS
jgi:hypothetical protein